MRVASKVWNLRSKFGHARPLGSQIIRYVRDGRTDRQTDGRTFTLLKRPVTGSSEYFVLAKIYCGNSGISFRFQICPAVIKETES